MKNFLTSCLIIVAAQIAFGQQALVDNVDGQWLIYNNGEKHLLDPSFHDLGNFDELGLTYFLRHDKYGIINDEGEVLLEEKFKSAQQLGGGYYIFLNDRVRLLGRLIGEKFEFRETSNFRELQKNWYIAQIGNSNVLFNTLGAKEWNVYSTDEIYNARFNYVHCELNDTVYLFDPLGNTVELGDKRPVFEENHLLLQTPNEKKVIYESHEVELPVDARDIRIFEKEILISEDGKSTILSSIDGRVISTFPYENVTYYGNSTLTFSENGKLGLLSKSGGRIVPAKYSMINKTGDIFSVRTANGAGIIDDQGQELVPCAYNYVRVYHDFFTVHNDLGLTGLISRKTQQNLLPSTYTSIMLSDTVVRAFASGMLRMLELDSDHRIVNDLVLTNVTSLESTRASANFQVDKRLFPLGWFIESVPMFDQEGFLIGDKWKWGLKDANDSLLIPARHSAPRFVENANFSLLPKGHKRFSLYGNNENDWPLMEVISCNTGKSLIPECVISLDTMDLLSRNYSRFISSKGLGILLEDNSILRVDYFDSHDPDYLRFCTSKKTKLLPAKERDTYKVKLPDSDLNNGPEFTTTAKFGQRSEQWVRFEEGEWNFLDTAGKVVFEEPFDFVEPYKFETAIVTKESKSGVVRSDSTVIPMQFASIHRSAISDTLFVVKRNINGLSYLDTNGRLMPREISRLYKSHGNLTQVEWNKNKALINSEYEVISGETHFQKLMDGDLFYSKEGKEFTIYDADGRQLGSVNLRPDEIWFKEFVLTNARGKSGILSLDGDTLVPFRYKKIEKIGNYIFAQDGLNNLLYNDKLEEVRNLKSNGVLVDSITGQFAEVQTYKAIVYSPEGKKLRKAKGTKFEHFHNGFLIDLGSELRIFGESDKFEFDTINPRSFQLMGQNGYLVEDKNGFTHYFDSNWKEVTFNEQLRDVKYVGGGLAMTRSQGGILLFGGDVSVYLKPDTRNVGTYQSGFLLTECHGSYEYINTEGVNEFHATFDDAQPFLGNYATAKETSGWTIIDRNGNYQILPNFDEITAESPTIFSTRARPVYGLFDSHGNELIPAEFQELNFLRNGIVQGRKDGEIFYFNTSGEPILLD